MVYDNLKFRNNIDLSAVDLRRFLSKTDYKSINITIKSSQVKLGHLIRLEKLKNINDNLKILSHTSGRKTVPDNKPYPQILTSH